MITLGRVKYRFAIKIALLFLFVNHALANESDQSLLFDSGRAKIFGVNYYRPNTGWAPQLWEQYDESSVESDFQKIHALGLNTIRVFLTYRALFWSGNELDLAGLEKLDHMIGAAKKNNIRLILVGLEAWEGVPSWAKGDKFRDAVIINKTKRFWAKLSSRYRGERAILSFELANEPNIPWSNTSVIDDWSSKFNDVIGVQKTRENVAAAWVAILSKIIKSNDQSRLVTIGLIQTSIAVGLGKPSHYSAFNPKIIGPSIDFFQIHLYPNEGGWYTYRSRNDELLNLAYLRGIVRKIRSLGKPVVIGEFGWYGGGQVKQKAGAYLPYASEDAQAKWGESLICVTNGLVDGWINWGMYDAPEANDVSTHTGLYNAKGKLKVWGERFSHISQYNTSVSLILPNQLHEDDWESASGSQRASTALKEAMIKKNLLEISALPCKH